MLSLSRKLCPFFSLIFLMSCGKKITESGSTSKPHIEEQLPSPTLIIGIEERLKLFVLERSGGFVFPEELRVRSNNALGKKITITYNIPPEDPAGFDYKCTYKGVTATSMPIEKCVDIDGYDLGNMTDGRRNPLDAGKTIKFESDSDDLQADAIFQVEWL
jgi:hypothetical protein